MKFSVNWLREFVELPDKIGELAELLTLAGVEIEGIEQHGANIDHVVVAQIIASSQHPNADRLSVCKVDDGSGTKRQIVCGAKNYKVGNKVPLALPGAKLPNGLEIKKSKLRGVDSEGMLCSPVELGMGAEAGGLLILSPEAKVGAPIADLFPSDTILDVEITPNRGDLLSHYGLAREIAALTDKKLVATNRVVAAAVSGGRSEKSLPPVTTAATIKILAPNECPFFSARRIDHVQVGPSPDWLRAKIESVGVRSINNIVDISNFVMLELGQPTHAFDADKLKGGFNVRPAQSGEKFLALDGKNYTLTPENLVIADDERAVGIGGVMGGEETGVTESTKNVFLEAAYFLPSSVRRTARNLNLPSDASYRFERGVDPGMVLRASQRAAELMREIAGGKPAKEINAAGELPGNPADVSFNYEKCDRLLGVSIEPKRVDEILTGFGLASATRSVKPNKSNKAEQEEDEKNSTWSIPSYRRDLQRDVDLIEEVVRAFGVQKISGSDRSRFTPLSAADRSHDFETGIRERLVAIGLAEARTSKLISRSAIAATGAVELRNPLTEDHVALRPSLLTGLLSALERNIRAGAESVAIFEIGRVFVPPSGEEQRRLGFLLWGNRGSGVHWRAEKRKFDMVDLKGILETISIAPLSLQRGQHVDLALAMDISLGKHNIGFGGQLSSGKTGDAPGAALVAEIKLDPLFAQSSIATFRELERFPSVARDIAMIVPEKISYEEIVRAIENPNEPLLESVELFDLFTGTDVGDGRKSLAYRLTYRDRSRTLTGEEVSAAHAKIRERLRDNLGAELRE